MLWIDTFLCKIISSCNKHGQIKVIIFKIWWHLWLLVVMQWMINNVILRLTFEIACLSVSDIQKKKSMIKKTLYRQICVSFKMPRTGCCVTQVQFRPWSVRACVSFVVNPLWMSRPFKSSAEMADSATDNVKNYIERYLMSVNTFNGCCRINASHK